MDNWGKMFVNWFRKKKPDGETFIKKNQTKKICLLMGIATLGIIFMIVGNLSSKPQTENLKNPPIEKENNGLEQVSQSNMTKEEVLLAENICQMLSQIQGAGEVEVLVRLSASSQSDYAVNTMTNQKTTQEKDQSGGTRIQTETTDNGQLVLIHGDNGNEIPVIERESAPEIAGVLVVAQGAGVPEIKARLFEATCVALGVEAHKIQVMPKKEGD